MDRITVKHLRSFLPIVAKACGKKVAGSWDDVGGWRIDGAYGGWQIQEVCSKSGGVTCITEGYLPAREVYEAMRYLLKGAEIKGE